MVFLAILIIIASVALGFFVLIQESKGGGLASNFASSNQIMGVRKTTNVVEGITWGLAAAILVLCMWTAFKCKKEYMANHPELQQTEQTQEAE